MAEDREDLAEVLSRICPDDATDSATLIEASQYAAAELMEHVLPGIRERVAVIPEPSRKWEIVRQATEAAISIRRDWLKQRGVYCGRD